MDYTGNSHKDKEKKEQLAEKKVEKVVSGVVVIKKKSLGQKITDTIRAADFKTVVNGIVHDVMIPAIKNMIFDAQYRASERIIYGDRGSRRRPGMGPHITYNNPINRDRGYGHRDPRMAPRPDVGPRRSRMDSPVVILESRAEAELVLERMNDIIEMYDVVSVADLNELIGEPISHIDNKWGWISLLDAGIRQYREGFLLDLPDAEPIK